MEDLWLLVFVTKKFVILRNNWIYVVSAYLKKQKENAFFVNNFISSEYVFF